ncbi:PsbP domain-containing protein 4, chloroplastic isoform X2, partial [Tanacetum coccineum]
KLVSIADPGGTEIDLRFSNASEGRITVVVAPVLRFADYLEDDARIEKIGPPEKVINKFGLEVIGQNVEGKVMNSEVKEYSGRKYYQFELELPHCLITATATGTVFTCSAYLQMVTYNPLSLSANKSASMMNFPQFSDACKSTCKSKSDCEDCDCGTTFAVPICFFDLCECVDAKRGEGEWELEKGNWNGKGMELGKGNGNGNGNGPVFGTGTGSGSFRLVLKLCPVYPFLSLPVNTRKVFTDRNSRAKDQNGSSSSTGQKRMLPTKIF